MTSAEEEYAEIYGPPARHSEHKIGSKITYIDPEQPSGRNSGPILYVAAATAREGIRYIVSPDVGLFPVEVAARESQSTRHQIDGKH